MYKTAVFILLVMAPAGCVAVWGRSYKIESQTSDSITIKYDSTFTTSNEVQKVAQANCDRYGKDAVTQEESTSVWRLTTASFLCANRRQ